MLLNIPKEEVEEEVEINTIRSKTFDSNEKHFLIHTVHESFQSKPKNSSSKTIFSIANNMIGSSIVVFALQFKTAGVISSLIALMIFGLISWKTCSLIVVHYKPDEYDMSEIVERILGKKWRIVFIASSSLIMFLVGIIQFILMNNMFYPFIQFMANDSLPSRDIYTFANFSFQYMGIISAVAVFLMINFLEIRILIKVSAIGIFGASLFIVFTFYKGILNLEHLNDLPLYGKDPKSYIILIGMYSLSFMIHNGIVTIIKHNRNFEKNPRDLFLGYFLAFLIYALLGVFGSLALAHFDTTHANTLFDCFEENYWQAILRLILGFQLLSVTPIALFIAKIHFLGIFYIDNLPSKKIDTTIYLIFLIVCYTVQSNNLNPTIIISISGSIGGFLCMYIIPIFTHIQCLKNVFYKNDTLITYEVINSSCKSMHQNIFSKFTLKRLYVFYSFIIIVGFICLVSQLFSFFDI